MSLVARISEAWSDSDEVSRGQRFDSLLSEDYVRHSDETTLNRGEFKNVVSELFNAFPDLTMTILDYLHEGDRFAYRWESVGTHTGTYLGVQETDQSVAARGLTMGRVVGGTIAEEWTSWDKASVLGSMGILRLT